MKLRIEFSCDSAAFEDDCRGEIERILRTVTEDLAAGAETGVPLYDANGNKVGEFNLLQS